MSEPTKGDLLRFARRVIAILSASQEWGSDELGEIATAAHDCHIELSHSSGDEDL